MMDETISDIQLPESVNAMLREGDDSAALTAKQMDELGKAIADKRKRYVDGRKISGIENIWTRAEDNMACIDETTPANSTMRPRFTKSMTLSGPLMANDTKADRESMKSTAFERLTARYVAAGSAKLCEIILAPGVKSFSLSETPVPDLVKAKEDLQQIVVNGVPLERDPTPEELGPPNPADPLAPAPANPAQPPSSMPGVPLTPKDLADEAIKTAHSKATNAETLIYDWMVEGKYTSHMRKVMWDCPRLGSGVLKGPFPELRKSRVVTKVEDPKTKKTILALEFKEELKPGFKKVSPWDFYPDPDCGEDIKKGDGCYERDFLSEAQLRNLIGTPGYIKSALLQCIKEGPIETESDKSDRPQPALAPTDKPTKFTIWHYYGHITKDEAECLNRSIELPSNSPVRLEEREGLPIQLTMVNDRVVCCFMNPLEKSGSIPYRVIPWEPREGSCWGVGVAEELFMPQEMVNAATRGMINNAGVSAGSQIVKMRGVVDPVDNNPNTIYGDKQWEVNPDSAGMDPDVSKAFQVFTIPNCTPQMLSIIQHSYLVGENSTNIPLISQGHSGKTTPDTFGAAQLQDNNANQLLRDVAARVDEYGTKPLVDDLYEWLMLDDNVSDDCKGDFQIKAEGSVALVEQAIKDQFIAQEYPMVKDPAFGINPKKWYAQLRRSKRLNPDDVQYTKEEQDKLAQVPPPKDPRVQVAEIKAQADGQALTQELQLRERIALLEYSIKQNISLTDAKTQLTDTAMKLRVQRELSAVDTAMDLHKHRNPSAEALTPPTEPAGRAPNGESFAR